VIKTRQNLQKPSFLICKSGVKNKVIEVFFNIKKCRKFCVMGRFSYGSGISVRGQNMQFVQYKNHYIYGESPKIANLCVWFRYKEVVLH